MVLFLESVTHPHFDRQGKHTSDSISEQQQKKINKHRLLFPLPHFLLAHKDEKQHNKQLSEHPMLGYCAWGVESESAHRVI